ncbi:MAG: VTC domain-containing protein [bacterium]|nr:VTC domain-containing protein [bacterium]
MRFHHDGVRYRYERKFYVGELSRAEVEMLVALNPAVFSTIFYPRSVNNIYLDTWSKESLNDNLIGSGQDRVKTRIRWYGALFGEVRAPKLELKIKHGHVNRKVTFELAPFTMKHGLRAADLHSLLRRADIPDALLQDLLKLEPALVNRYRRSYFRSFDRAFRVTVDSDLEFYAAEPRENTFPPTRPGPAGIIVELKYAEEIDSRADQVTQGLPFRLTRSSKYATGVAAALDAW